MGVDDKLPWFVTPGSRYCRPMIIRDWECWYCNDNQQVGGSELACAWTVRWVRRVVWRRWRSRRAVAGVFIAGWRANNQMQAHNLVGLTACDELSEKKDEGKKEKMKLVKK